LIKSVILLIFFLFSAPCLAQDITLTILYNNVPYNNELTTAWGMSCLIEGLEKTIILDTGGDGSVLLDNMSKLKVDPTEVDAVLLSHIHADHTEGLWSLLEKNRQIVVYFPESFPVNFKDRVKNLCRDIVSVHKPRRICEQAWSTGELGSSIKEQSLVIDTKKGLIVITGCAHPGIVNIAKFAESFLKKKVYLVLGGFHLMAYSKNQVKQIIEDLKELGIKQVAPSHCTGARTIELFREAWGDDFIELGCGAKIVIDQN